MSLQKAGTSLATLALLLLLGVALLGLPTKAEGLQFYFFFQTPYSNGGSGGEYFTGSPRYKLFDCRACHVGSPGKIRVHLRTEPEDVFLGGYWPGETYTVILELEDETLAPPIKIFSTNNFCIEAIDACDRQAGSFDTGFPWNPLSQLFDPVVISPDGTTMTGGFLNFDLQYQWLWTAPPPGTGTVTFYGGFVDGNGDLKTFGDDVAILKKRAHEHSP